MARPRLDDLLSDAVTSSALTLVSAPAGAGKTVAVSSWAATDRLPGPSIWLPTARPGRGTNQLWSALAHWLAGEAGIDDRSPVRGRPDFSRLAELTGAVATVAGPVVVVVDEDESAPDPTLHAELDRYLEAAAGSVRVVLLTRSDPLLPLHRYRLASGLSEIRADDLRFSCAEAADLFGRAGVDVTDDQLATLVDRTCGWAAGLTFAAAYLAGQKDIDAAVSQFTGSQRAVSDYLAKEVLDAQPPNLRELMLRTSIAEELPTGLFEELSGEPDGRQAMAFLAGSNAFIGPVPGNPTFYKYQPLFREFLRSRLSFERPELLAELHGVAACWWARRGNLRESAVHAAAAGRWSGAASYAVENLAVGQLMDDRLDDSLAELFGAMPADTEGAPAAIVRAALALRDGDVPRARATLADARAELATSGIAGPADAFSVELLEAAVAVADLRFEEGLEGLRLAERHLTTVQPSEPDLRPELITQIALLRSQLRLWSGSLDGGRAALVEAAEATEPIGGPLRADALTQCAVLTAILGDGAAALSLLDRWDQHASEHTRQSGPAAARAAVTRAWVLTEQANVRAARTHLDDADRQRADLSPSVTVVLEIVRARLLHADGDYAGARSALAAARASIVQRPVPAWLAEWVELAAAVHDAAEGSTGAGQGTMAMAMPQWVGDTPLELQVTGLVHEADVRLRRGDQAAAVASASRALRLAAPQSLRRPFTEAPPTVRQLLRSHAELQAAHPWLDPSPDHVRGVPRPRTVPALESRGMPLPVVVEPLTSKELEVLGHLTDLATTAEIGAAMFISVNTVRTHVRNILRKLGTDRRNAAVRRAWELGLVPGPGSQDRVLDADATGLGGTPIADRANGRTA